MFITATYESHDSAVIFIQSHIFLRSNDKIFFAYSLILLHSLIFINIFTISSSPYSFL